MKRNEAFRSGMVALAPDQPNRLAATRIKNAAEQAAQTLLAQTLAGKYVPTSKQGASYHSLVSEVSYQAQNKRWMVNAKDPNNITHRTSVATSKHNHDVVAAQQSAEELHAAIRFGRTISPSKPGAA